MTDIVKRLRLAMLYEGRGELSVLPEEAADEIERLRGEVDEYATKIVDLVADRERLRAALRYYAETFCEGPPEVCGSLSDIRCSGCKARAALGGTHDAG